MPAAPAPCTDTDGCAGNPCAGIAYTSGCVDVAAPAEGFTCTCQTDYSWTGTACMPDSILRCWGAEGSAGTLTTVTNGITTVPAVVGCAANPSSCSGFEQRNLGGTFTTAAQFYDGELEAGRLRRVWWWWWWVVWRGVCVCGPVCAVTSSPSLPASHGAAPAGIWCGCENQLYAAFECKTAGRWRLAYQNTYIFSSTSTDSYVWATVEASPTANANIKCSTTAGCPTSPTTALMPGSADGRYQVEANFPCTAGQWVVLHEEFSVACLYAAAFIPS